MFNSDERIVMLLTELLDVQIGHLAWARTTMQQSLDAQQIAIGLQGRTAKLYRIVVLVAAVLVAGAIT